MHKFLSCDWGTSAFRLRLVDAGTQNVLSAITSQHGIAETFSAWKQHNLPEDKRASFYQDYLMEQVALMETSLAESLIDIPIILSGMASSSIGMVELPYKQLPFATNGDDLFIETLPQAANGLAKVYVVSGAKTSIDVLRGEETILVGCDAPGDDFEHLYIFPGTHSKHITVQNGRALNFTTYMTGELFDLMSSKSILASSVAKNGNEDSSIPNEHFAEGVLQGTQSNLLSSMFKVRVKQLFNEASPVENYQYLSGLLIGNELAAVEQQKANYITLVAGEALRKKYIQALQIVGLVDKVDCINADEALINGQAKIYRLLLTM